LSITRKNFLKSLVGASMAWGFSGGTSTSLVSAQQTASSSPKRRAIADVTIYPFSLELKEAERVSFGTIDSAENVLVRLRTGDGVVGWGESSPEARVTGDTQASNIVAGKQLAEVIRGQDPFDIPKIVAAMDEETSGEPGIKAALEMAVWDICGKAAGQPVRRLLGNWRDSFETDITVYLNTPQIMAEQAKAYLVAGFRMIKIKLGETPEADIARLRAIREAVGKDVWLRIDANQGWSPADAVKALRALEKFDIQFCEQPVVHWDREGLKRVRNSSPIPVMADESVHGPRDAVDLVRLEATDMFNIKLMKSGGILQAVRMAHIADAANIKCMLGCMDETRLALTAAAHVVCSQPNTVYADLDACFGHKVDPIVGGIEIKNGIVRMPEAPGLGVDIDPAWLRTLRAV